MDTNYNIDVVKLYLQDARNLKSFLETGKKELTEEQKEKLDKLNDMIIPSLRDKTLLKCKEIYNDDNNEEYQILKEKLKVLPETRYWG
ncbi:hypothetical protein A3305_02425 [Rickettsia amblyommatis]|uniref:Uncharacterized protein n=1 Tax=Rickettsia amblyommatis (strain GAT-30V) TaxID=1105111 RepID=H8K3L8_RICAG|nr:hypothetical protein [Rickettsia amblyommatis]AFC69112.1 hypothetical protein MCE_00285 [Rickettsia amblyommatis str. GAT-30V]ALA61280.1 hypothetical protein AL573_00265 [Rickettsia amblyommatis]ARD87390.1 hypothetical protein A3305_02425 [Rickettsia amblyommatis]KJV97948.1 hypothetical protein RAMDARK_0075 [Rickettsia amblyommatis str. Darkwater]